MTNQSGSAGFLALFIVAAFAVSMLTWCQPGVVRQPVPVDICEGGLLWSSDGIRQHPVYFHKTKRQVPCEAKDERVEAVPAAHSSGVKNSSIIVTQPRK